MLLLVSGVQAEQTVSLGDWAKVTAPTEYEQGVAFPVKVDLLKVDGPTKLVMNANWLKDSGAFGGFLQLLNINEDVSGPKTFEFNVTISKTKPNLKSVSLALYLSPDGEWKNKTASGIVTLTPKAKQGTGHEAMEYEKITAEVKPFYMNSAPPVATLAEGGFAAEPSFVDNFDPGWPNKDAWRVATWKQNGTMMSPERCYVDDPATIRSLLVDQVTGAVRWRESVEWMAAKGVDDIWEVGAGKALCGMIRRIDRSVTTRNIGTPEDVVAAKAALV